MKRKISDSNHKDPLQIHIPSHRGGFHGIRSSDSRFPIATPPRTTGTSCKKRVTFTDSQDDENQRPPRCEIADNAKTSEYAFFKKLKEGAGRKAQSCSLREEVDQRKNSESSDCSRERINVVRNKREDTRSSFFNENATPELNIKRACATLENAHRRQNNMVEECDNSLRSKETENRRADVFDRKRQKLHQWVAETSFPEIDEHCSKGYDFVSVLLSRLIPKCNETNEFKDRKLRQLDTNDKSMALPSYESDIQFRKLHSTPTRNFMDLEFSPCLNDSVSSCWSKRSKERILCSDSPTSYAYKNHLQYRVWEPDHELLGGTAISCTESDSLSLLPFEEYGLLTSGHAKEIDVFRQPNEYLVDREPCVPMLGWDFDSTEEDRSLSNLSTYRTEHQSASFASYYNNEILRHCLEGHGDLQSGFQQIPLTLSSCIPNFINLAEDCINDTAYEVGSTTLSLQNNHWFSSKIINEGYYLPNTESFLSSGLDSDLGWNYLPLSGSSREHDSSTCLALQFPEQENLSSRLLTYHDDKYETCLDDSSHPRSLTHFIEDNVNVHEDSSAFCLQIALDREKTWPLLLDKPSWDESNERETNFADSDVNILDSKVSFRQWLHYDV
ncbi:uncharacterized protein LOC125472392 [Pyrus x bretschneideri]|uniref:uncharacterized protein LOC125472392 n=1 Tax=Pyrus x bretschneideri TaxID=225117 RepID=UPI00202DD89B|nr:uncharacterized protein LOC125472392 [Pyrus x bretschneideri]